MSTHAKPRPPRPLTVRRAEAGARRPVRTARRGQSWALHRWGFGAGWLVVTARVFYVPSTMGGTPR